MHFPAYDVINAGLEWSWQDDPAPINSADVIAHTETVAVDHVVLSTVKQGQFFIIHTASGPLKMAEVDLAFAEKGACVLNFVGMPRYDIRTRGFQATPLV